MKILKGTINSMSERIIPDECVVVICIYDSSNLDKNLQPTLLQKYQIECPKSFPIKYEIAYPPFETNIESSRAYYLSVRIFSRDEKILFSNNCKDQIALNHKYRKHLDVYLYYLPDFNTTFQEETSYHDGDV